MHCNISNRPAGRLSCASISRKQLSRDYERDLSGVNIVLKNFDDFQKLNKTNIDAMTKMFGEVTRNAQAITTEMTEFSKRSYDNSSKLMERLLGVRSIDKAIEVQTEFAKSSFDDYTAQISKLGELYTDLAKSSFKPFEMMASKPASEK